MFLSDSPIWSIGEYQGMVSVFDALFAIAPFITKSELFNFLDVAFEVLSEDDPSLDLPVIRDGSLPAMAKHGIAPVQCEKALPSRLF